MSETTIILLALVAFVGGFVFLFWKMIQPSRRLFKILGDGTRAGLRLIRPEMPEWHTLPPKLDPLLKVDSWSYKLGLAYEFAGGEGYLLSIVEIDRMRTKKKYRRLEVVVRRVNTGLDSPLAIRPLEFEKKLPRPLRKVFDALSPEKADTSSCLPEFREKFGVVGKKANFPERVQRILLEAADPNGFNFFQRFELAGRPQFFPEGFTFTLAYYKRPKNVADVRQLLDFVEELARGFRFA